MLVGVAMGFIADFYDLDEAMFTTYAVLLIISLRFNFMFPKYETNDLKEKKENKADLGAFKELLKNNSLSAYL